MSKISSPVGDWTVGEIRAAPKSPMAFTFEEDWTIEDDDYSYTVCEYSDDDPFQDENIPYPVPHHKGPKSPKSPGGRASRVVVRRRQNSSPRKSSSSTPHQILNRNPTDFFVKYCNEKIDAQQLIASIVDHVMKNSETARQMAMTLNLVVKDEQNRGQPSVLPALLKHIQSLFGELQSQANVLSLDRVLGTVALLCACYECLRTDDDIPMLKPLMAPIVKALDIMLAYNPDTGRRGKQIAQDRCTSALRGHLYTLGKSFDDTNPALMDSLYNNIRSTTCYKGNSTCRHSESMTYALLELVELRAYGWMLPQSNRDFYGKMRAKTNEK